VVFRRGQALKPAEIGMLASLGINEVPVYRRLVVAFFSTGDELVSIGTPLATGQIYDSNRYTIGAMLARMGLRGDRHGRGRRRAAGARARVPRRRGDGRRRDHLRRRVGRRGGFRQAADGPARRGRVLEDRDEARAGRSPTAASATRISSGCPAIR
jgi:molybdopterin biosynthesis enzyme